MDVVMHESDVEAPMRCGFRRIPVMVVKVSSVQDVLYVLYL